jgi:TIR domain/inactive STAND
MLKLFISYSHSDRRSCEQLAMHLAALEGAGLIRKWSDDRIRPGDEWSDEISRALEQADIIILLVSPSYISSTYCTLEAERAMDRYNSGNALVIPVLLDYLNLSECAFEKLQTIPSPDRPIRSKHWKNANHALSEVSKAIETVIRAMIGSQKTTRLVHPNSGELITLLHFLCDRVPQSEALIEAFSPTRRKLGRPFVIFLQGGRLDSLEQFLNRLQHVLLPQLLGSKPGRLSPISWPEYRRSLNAQELFRPKLAESLGISPWATVEEIQNSLREASPLTILPLAGIASEWSRQTHYLLEKYIDFWEAWPDSTEGRMLLPTISLHYDIDEKSALKIQKQLERFDLSSQINLNSVVLPPLPLVKKTDFRTWLQHQRVRGHFESPDRIADQLDIVLPAKIWPSLMHPLAEVHLPRFLEQI